jgi:hypothetical protein
MESASSLGLIADVIAIGTLVFSIGAAVYSRRNFRLLQQEQTRKNEKVKIILSAVGGRQREVPLPIRRGDVTRAEILGLIGMIPINKEKQIKVEQQPRFRLPDLGKEDFLHQLDEVRDGKRGPAVIIRCTDEELDQFDLDALR